MMRTEELKDYVLTFPSSQVSITDITNSFWHDTAELKELGKTLKDWKERRRIKANLRNRVERVRLAFNQLFLEGKVRNHEGLNFVELKERAIKNCKEHIEITRQMVQRGEGGILTKCWLGNLRDYLEGYKKTEVIRRSQLNPIIRHVYKAKGALICVGSSLVMQVYPTTIRHC